MATKKGKKTEDSNAPHPYDFSLKRQTKLDREAANLKPIRPDLMAAGMLKAHGLEKAKRIVEPLTTKSFKDGQGNPVAVNGSANYWTTVLQHLNRGVKNAVAG